MRLTNILVPFVLSAALLSGCGGGGGGGGALPIGVALNSQGVPVATTPPDQDGSSQDANDHGDAGSGQQGGRADVPILDPNFTTIDVSIDKVFPESVKAEFFEGAQTVYQDFFGSAKGNLNLLVGRDLYIYVEDPEGIFGGEPVKAELVGDPATVAHAKLYTSRKLKPGQYSGSFNIYVCLDARCSVRFKDLPYSLPYDVKVKKSVRFAENDATSIAVRSQFAPEGTTISLPLNPPDTSYHGDYGHPLWSGPRGMTATVSQVGGRPTLNIALPPMVSAGHHTLSFNLFQGTTTLNDNLVVELDVVPNPAAPFAFAKQYQLSLVPAASLEVQVKASESESHYTEQLIISVGEGTMTYEGASFFDLNGNPASPAASPWNKVRVFHYPADVAEYNQNTGWGWVTRVLVDACAYGFPSVPNCRTPGEYWMQLRYRHEANGTSQIVYFPVRLLVAP